MRIVPSLDKFEDSETRLRPGGEPGPIEEFAFKRGEEALAHRIVEAVPNRAHGPANAGAFAALSEGDRGVLGRFNRPSQQWLCGPTAGTHLAPRPVFSSPAFCAAEC